MSNLKNRLATLESKTPVTTDPIKICWFTVHSLTDDPIGYESDCGATIKRLPGETVEELRSRCGDLANWEHEGRWRIFDPIF